MIGILKAAAEAARNMWRWPRRAGGEDAGGKPRLLVDVSTIFRHDARTGIQRVVRAVWSELLRRSGDDFEVVPVYATTQAGYRYAPLDFLERKRPVSRPEMVRARAGDRFLGLDLAAHLLPKYRRQIQSWRAAGASVHLVVYDLLPLMRPGWFTATAVRRFGKWVDLLSREADQAICISGKVSEDLRQQLQSSGVRRHVEITRLRMGGDITASVPSTGVDAQEALLLERLRFRPAVLMVSTIEPRKGHDVALAAFEHLWATRGAKAPDLVIIGKPGWKTKALQDRLRSHPEQGKRLHWLERVSDEGLCLFYERCRGLLVASHEEGFGLPLIEAAMHGCPVLARDLVVFHEQGLPTVMFFEDDRPEPLAASVIDLIAIPHGARQVPADLPTWSDSVDRLLVELGLATAGDATNEALRQAS